MTARIQLIAVPKVGFASHQNSVPILRELEVVNESEDVLEGLELRLTSDPVFIEERRWPIDRINPGSTLHISDRDLRLNGTLLGDLSEKIRAELRLELWKGEERLSQLTSGIELLARAEWGGSGTMAELLPAFVMPNDPAVDKLLKASSDVLRRAGKPDGIDGYESGSRTRVWQLVSAMWSAVAGAEISYALPPASFETEGQKVRTPASILEGRVATCLDTALLFAALMEQAGLNPLLIMTEGHAFCGVWLQPEEFSSLLTDDASAVRKRFDLDELLVFETTLVTRSPVPRFDLAVAEARRQISSENEGKFVMAVDVRRARMQKISPLAASRTPETVAGDVENDVRVSEALLDAPQLPGFDVEVPEDSNSPIDRVMLWQRKLLDLTTRNRLLHVPDNAKVVSLLCPEPALLEDRLSAGRKIKVVSLPDLEAGGRDSELFRQQTSTNLQHEYAREALARGEVLSTLEKTKLEASLIELYRKARSDLEEGGANTLFLSLGSLRWKKAAEDSRQYRAPLILLPVKLERKSAISGVTLLAHEDEPRFNLTLLELLRHDFELQIPGLDGSLPSDDSGVDVVGIWNMVRRAVRDLPGFEVLEDVMLGTFSFAKYLMWRDLVDRQDQLKESSVVRHLIERGAESFQCRGEFPQPEELDRKIDPAKLFAPLPADSSQLSAVVASGNDCDFVLDGPPGTGKSQTIANMIAHNLALGRRVLFVAEKRAALDVVYRRLEEKGLGDFCLELHSNKTSKADVLKQLERAWDARDALSEEEWNREAAEVRRLRDSLNGLVHLLHAEQPNGLTLHEAVGRVVRDADEATPKLDWPSVRDHSREKLASLRDVVRRLGLAHAAVEGLPESFTSIRRTSWSNSWQEALISGAAELEDAVQKVEGAAEALLRITKLPLVADSRSAANSLSDLVAVLLETYSRDIRFAFTPDCPAKIEAAKKAIELLRTYHSLEGELSVNFAPEAVRRLDLDALDAKIDSAAAKFWFFATLAKKKVAKELAQQGSTAGLPDLDNDPITLRRLKALLGELDTLVPSLSGVPGWNVTASDVGLLTTSIDLAERLRSKLVVLSSSSDQLIEMRRVVSGLALDANELLAPEGSIAISHAKLNAELGQHGDVIGKLAELNGEMTGGNFEDERSLSNAIRTNQTKLNAWCNWYRVREEAIAAELLPIVEALEKQHCSDVQQVFEVAYARWFAGRLIDEEPRLAELITDVHMSDIELYRMLEDKLSELSVRYIRAKLCGRIPDKNNVSRKDGYGVLKHQLQLQRRHKPVRQLATEMGDAFTTLAPCMLMSPLSIAQYLPAAQALFDLVIFDEASQIAPWDAIGSIARGRQVVIAGDPRQMPPTNFFNRAPGAADDDGSTDEDMESILDECLAAGVPQRSLAWHYRSRHESLIAFSNNRYYESRLITFPAPETRESAVTWRKIDGVYAKGAGRTNQAEAEAMVHETVQRLLDPAFIASRKTLALVTLNSEQQRLVEDLLDKARRQHPRIERFFAEELTEPVVVKNLETVQGDERDVILLGIGYGPTEPGAPTMSMNFGPLNRDGGWRRLNVALTRARQEMVLFTSFDASLIDLNRTSARAVRDLKHFIEFAERGPRALAEAIQGSVGGYESPFEEAVAQALKKKGWNVVPQIGVSRFRIDLGVVHPDRPGSYLVGVECDGAAYHSAATARDRDKVRAAILEGLGWKLVRTWSTDWWVDKEGATERLHAEIEKILKRSREDLESELSAEADASLPREPSTNASVQLELAPPDAGELYTANHTSVHFPAPPAAPSASSTAYAHQISTKMGNAVRSTYRLTDFAEHKATIDPDAFYEPAYNATLLNLIGHVLETEAPISEAALVQRIARAHGFQRAGRIIRTRVMQIAKRHFHVVQGVGDDRFIWSTAEARASFDFYRLPTTEIEIRQIEDIAPEEIRAAATACSSTETEVEIARLFGIRRLSSSARSKISAALEQGLSKENWTVT
jgi:very-short-patch-repair endonuclease